MKFVCFLLQILNNLDLWKGHSLFSAKIEDGTDGRKRKYFDMKNPPDWAKRKSFVWNKYLPCLFTVNFSTYYIKKRWEKPLCTSFAVNQQNFDDKLSANNHLWRRKPFLKPESKFPQEENQREKSCVTISDLSCITNSKYEPSSVWHGKHKKNAFVRNIPAWHQSSINNMGNITTSF